MSGSSGAAQLPRRERPRWLWAVAMERDVELDRIETNEPVCVGSDPGEFVDDGSVVDPGRDFAEGFGRDTEKIEALRCGWKADWATSEATTHAAC